MGETTLRHTLRHDLDAIIEIWVEAFAQDPYLRWIQPDDAGWPSFGSAWMTFIVELAFERGHTYLDAGGAVAMAWIPPDIAFVNADDVARGRAIIAEHAGDARADEALETIMAARGHALEEPHWTLQYIGVRPSSSGQGLGAATIAPMLATCDSDGVACGLVSTNPRNVAFYERASFERTVEIKTPDGAAVLTPMQRSVGT